MKFIHHIDARISNLYIYATSQIEESITSLKKPIELNNDALHESLLNYFLSPFNEPLFYQFEVNNSEFNFNKPIELAFKSSDSNASILNSIIKRISDYQHEENTPLSYIITAQIDNLILEDEVINAIAIFVTENNPKFISIDSSSDPFIVNLQTGFPINKAKFACLVFDTDKNSGYKVCARDNSKPFITKSNWIDEVLLLSPKTNAYRNTKETIKLTKQFLKEQVSESPDLDKTYEAHILNNSLDYFQNVDDFDNNDYAAQVFEDSDTASNFKTYKGNYAAENKTDIPDNFSINLEAVKNQSRVFKSVLKLDKNFHIYIHGNKNMIEKGLDTDGRKFYKLFYDQEK